MKKMKEGGRWHYEVGTGAIEGTKLATELKGGGEVVVILEIVGGNWKYKCKNRELGFGFKWAFRK